MSITRVFALLLALAVPFTLAACGENAEEVEIEDDGEVDTDD